MNKRIILSLLILFLTLPFYGQIRGNNIVVSVTPDHKDWNYNVGQTATFTVNVRRSGTLMEDVRIDMEAGPVMYPDVKKSLTLKDGTMTWKGKMAMPGFYRLKVTAHSGGKDYEGLCTAAFSPERVRPMAQCPDDFDAFWKRALDAARAQDLNPTMTLLPDRCTKDDDVYEVSFVNDGPSSRIYGILSVPRKAGKYPALLRVPGAGVRPYGGDTYTAAGRCIVLEIGIHGIPVTLRQDVYDRLLGGSLNGYWETNLDRPGQNYYRRVVTGAVRAVDFIASQEKWNGQSLGVTGSSQGGFLSLATAALDKRVTFLGVVHDAMCDYEAELHGVAGGWPHYFYDKGRKYTDNDMKSPLLQARVAGARYYDGVNFARRCTQPAWFSFGLNDEVVPPTSSYGVYNIYPAAKQLSVYPMTGHFWYQEQWDEWQAWLTKQMGL
ncbi:MAG: acetylxylan esterase [Prevotella sp.]|nr:acetylxylan esterase [Prevotella sp.]